MWTIFHNIEISTASHPVNCSDHSVELVGMIFHDDFVWHNIIGHHANPKYFKLSLKIYIESMLQYPSILMVAELKKLITEPYYAATYD